MGKRIGLNMAYKGLTNYGAILQAFATQKVVEKFGSKTEILDFIPGSDKGVIVCPEYYLSRAISFANKLFHKKKATVLDEEHAANRDARKNAAKAFISSKFHNIVVVKGKEELERKALKYDAVLVGSDQLWAPNVAFTYYRSLRFVPDSVRRISYATSLGVSKYPWYVKRQASIFLNRIDYLSVREEKGREIIKEVSGRDAKVVLDPTYLLTKQEWEALIPSERIIDGGYVLCYILGDNPGMKKLAKEYAQRHGLKMVSIMSCESNCDDTPYSDEIVTGKTPDEFINMIRFANCVFTDSFHGFAFSVINEKQVYITYRTRVGTQSRNSRIDNIVRMFGMEDRLIKDPASVDIQVDHVTDYRLVSNKVRELRDDSLEFLKSALTFPNSDSEDKTTLYESKADCCGCEACTNVCPNGIIEMTADGEGFYYPHITDVSKCVGCNACHYVCPVEHADSISSSFTKAYAGWAKKDIDIISSSSGGFAATLADSFLRNDGLVYGVAYTPDFSGAQYIRVSSKEQAELLKTSKYIQARKYDVYHQVKEDLKTKKVLFTGLPCDVYALKRFIKDDSNLYTLSIICHGPTSEMIHQQYCALVEKKLGSKITRFSVRYKKNGQWKPYYIHALGGNDTEYLEQFYNTDYNKAFLYFKRPSCGNCKFKNNHFAADILVGDYHAASNGSKFWNEHGVSSIMPLTDRGKEMLQFIDSTFVYSEVPLMTAISQKAVHSSVNKETNRKEFVTKLSTLGLKEACLIPSIRKDFNKSKVHKRRAAIIKRIKYVIKKVVKK